MTLRTIESELGELLQKQLKEDFPLDMTLEGPLMAQMHPKVLRAKLQFLHNPEQEPIHVQIPGWNYEVFKDCSAAEKKYPHISLRFVGKPWALSKFLNSQNEEALVDFGELGTVALSKLALSTEAGREMHHYTLPQWLDYALSPELWGTQGKWTRFHSRLHDVLKKKNLLSDVDSLGYYPLKPQAQILETHGFVGTNLDKSYLFVLPWTFSLHALNKLEEVILQEF